MNAVASFRPADRVTSIGVSEILVRSARAVAYQRAGRPVVILGAGEPDFDTPDIVKAAACRAIADGQTKYTALDGSPDLKAAVVAKFERENGLRFDLDEITCGTGAKQIIYNAFMASLNPGDEVIIPAPYWTSYSDIVRIAGGVPVVLACPEAAGFLLQPEQLEGAISPRTRWLLLNSPSNPSGAVYDAQHLASLAQVIRRRPHVWVMSDDIYEHILYDGLRFVTFAQVAPDLRDRTLTINGVSKAYAMTGWRIGYGAGPASLIATMAIVQSQSTSCPSSIGQAAAVAALNSSPDVRIDRARSFQQRRDLVVSALNAIPELNCRKPSGAFYVYPGCQGVIGMVTSEGTLIADDRDFADYLLKRDVAVIPGSCFGLAPYFRISYATSQNSLMTAIGRIAAACSDLRSA